jgi:hypothetical protein
MGTINTSEGPLYMRISMRKKLSAPTETGPKVYVIPTEAEYRNKKPDFCDIVGERWKDVYGHVKCDRCKKPIKAGETYIFLGSTLRNCTWTTKYAHYPDDYCEAPVEKKKKAKRVKKQ